MKRTWLALTLVFLLVFPTMAGAAVEMSAVGEYPIVSEPLTLKATAMQTDVQIGYNDVWVLNEYEKKSGIDIEWTNIPSADISTQLNLMFASLDLPDILFKTNISATQQSQYGGEGVLIDLAQYAELMPNLMGWYEQFPTAEDAMTQPGGERYSTNYILAGDAIRIGVRVYFNTDALAKVNMEVPTTLDELYEYLKALKAYDYNENGEDDTIPLGQSAWTSLEAVLFGSFGLMNRGSSHGWADMGEDGKARFFRTTDEYKELIRYYAKLYQEGLIDPDTFASTDMFADLIAKAQSGRTVNYLFVNNTPVTNSQYEQYTLGMKEPFEGFNGEKMWSNYSLPASQGGQFSITYKNEYPEISARWADYWYSEEGMIGYFMGEEGVTYTNNGDGTYDLTDFVVKNEDGINFEQVMAPWVIWAGGANPSVATNELFKGGETWPVSLESAAGLINYTPDKQENGAVWAPFVYDGEISSELSTMTADFTTYRNEWAAAFVTGSKDIDADWDEYVNGFNALGVEEYLGYRDMIIEEKGLK